MDYGWGGGKSRVRDRDYKLHVSEIRAVCQDESSERKQSGGDESQVMAVGRWKEADMAYYKRSLMRIRSQ